MVERGAISPSFSLALPNRDEEKGYIALGGLPPVEIHGAFTSAEVYKDPLYSNTSFTEYAINATSMTYSTYHDTGSSSLDGLTIIDTGTISVDAPNDVVTEYNKLFDPPAIYDKAMGFWVIECDTKGPKEPFDVVINSTTFSIPGQNFALDKVVLDENGLGGGKYAKYCFCGLQSAGIFGGTGNYVLGRPFLETVVAVFDVGAKEMRFAARK